MTKDKLTIVKDKSTKGDGRDYILYINDNFWNRYHSLERAQYGAEQLLRLRPDTATLTIDLRG